MKAIKSALVSPWIGMIGILFTDSWKWKFYYKRNRLSSIYYTFSDTYGHPLSNGAKNYPKEQITWELITSLILKHWKYMPVKWIHFHGQNLNSLEKSLLKYRKKLTSWEWRKFYKVCTFFNFNLILLFKINHVKTLGGWVGPMGPTETKKNFVFAFFSIFRFSQKNGRTKNEKWIFFIFYQFLALCWTFLINF